MTVQYVKSVQCELCSVQGVVGCVNYVVCTVKCVVFTMKLLVISVKCSVVFFNESYAVTMSELKKLKF